MNGDLEKIIEKVHNHLSYEVYYDNKYSRPMFTQQSLNCSDEVVPGSNARRRKMFELMNITEYTEFTETYSRIVYEMHEILLDETMLFLGCTERQAKLWIDKYVDFTRVYLSEKDGRKYMYVKPIFMKKY